MTTFFLLPLAPQLPGIPALEGWLRGLIVAGGILAALLVARYVLTVRLAAMARRTSTQWDDLLVLLVRRTWTVTLVLPALWSLAGAVDLAGPPHEVLRIGTVILLALQVATWGNLVVAQVLESRVAAMRSADPSAATTLSGVTLVTRGLLGVLVLLLALDNLGVNISSLVAGLGIGGVAIALATQNILGDLFASLSIVLDKPFVVGDFIVVGELMGTVERVGLKTTRLRSLSGEQLVFSNADLLGSRVRNYKRMTERRVVFAVGVTYQTPADRLAIVPGLLEEVVRQQPLARFERAHLKSFDDSCITFEVVYHVLDPDYTKYMDVQQQINLETYRRFAAAGLDFAYPTRTLFVRTDPEGDGNGPGSGAGTPPADAVAGSGVGAAREGVSRPRRRIALPRRWPPSSPPGGR